MIAAGSTLSGERVELTRFALGTPARRLTTHPED